MYVVTISRQGVKVSGEQLPERGDSLSKSRDVRHLCSGISVRGMNTVSQMGGLDRCIGKNEC